MQLESLVREARDAGIARRALVLRLSLLPRHAALPHHLRLARDAVEPLAMADRARVFVLPNRDIVVIWRGPAEVALDQSLDAIRLLFEDDVAPLADWAALTSLLQLPEEAEMLLEVVAAGVRPSPFAPVPPPPPPRRLDLATLAAVETALDRADIARMVRRRAVCSRTGESGMRLRWESRLLSIGELTEAVAPGFDITADPWLFRRLTRVLDRRMLALLAAAEELRGAGPFGLSLNVASLLGPEFLRFDAALPATLRGHVVIGLAAWDILGDPAAFLFARDFARARQYKLLLRGIAPDLIDVLPLHRTGLDLVEILWNDALLQADPDRLALEPRRVILSGVDTPEALAWCENLGAGFISGRLATPDVWRGPGG